MSIQEIFRSEFLKPETEVNFTAIHKLECEEVLDNLGYIELDRNSGKQTASFEQLEKGISLFRQEYDLYKLDFHKSIDRFGTFKSHLLSEEELDFLHELSSLEGEFELHHYPLKKIEQNPILSRVLNWRLGILSIFNKSITNQLSNDLTKHLNLLGSWCNISGHEQIIELLGNMEDLSMAIAKQDFYSGSDYRHLIYFKNSYRKLKDKGVKFTSNKKRFESRLPFIPKESQNTLNLVRKKKVPFDSFQNDQLHQLMTRLVQIRLWLLGNYQGKLDNDLGPLSITGIHSLISYIHESYGGKQGYKMSDLLMRLGNDRWVLNVNYLFKALLPVLVRMESDKKMETISEEFSTIINKLEKEEDKKEVLKVIDQQIKTEFESPSNRKSKTRGGKRLLRSIGRFFKRIGDFIKDGIQWVIESIKNLFKWFKNGIKILVRELKKAFHMAKTALSFFFSKRIVKSQNTNSQLITDYDFNFDSLTTVIGTDKELIEEHIRKNRWITNALEEVSEFLGTVISIAIKIAKGPMGWIQLGIEVIKYLVDNKFHYNRLSLDLDN
ncbi:hypothetical protein [Marinifilum flexuosum]|uniref:Uncharacterized protein n=1 Tax=Marinifilum flexuosum TaxID=1117708 RepID=A0A419WTP0_9BACT|nr:hypothetical protein [Marinifilum flexuosum]RKD98758.1 hypothetical protein BXY64_3621 [Marinifilum flexuosum]